MDFDTAAESDMSLKSRSFLHRVNDLARKILGLILKKCNTIQQQTFFNMENVYYVFNIGSICIHGKELLGKMYIRHESEIHRESHSICTRDHYI